MSEPSPEYLRGYRAGTRAAGAGMKPPRKTPAPAGQTLDVVAGKVGPEFPALGTAVREAWTSGA